MQPKQKFLELARPYCDLMSLLSAQTARQPGKIRGIDFYNSVDLRVAVANSLEIFVLGNGYLPSIQSPKTFNEKVFATKFLVPFSIPSLADKVYVNQTAAALFGENHVAEIVWFSDTAEQLEQVVWSLPDGIYYFKANHASGTNLRITLTSEDRTAVAETLKLKAHEWLSDNFGYAWGEFHYSTFPKKIFLEKSLGTNDAVDYRFFCFKGEPRLIQVDQNSYSQQGHTRDYFDVDWNLMPILQGFPMSSAPPPCPKHLDTMVGMAKVMATKCEMPFSRIDFFWSPVFGVKVGEVTLTPTNAYRAFSPDFWNTKVGEWWEYDNSIR
ncbi:ATP-grasp fold amidoligase family protein [Microvirga soli]|uniref:ATP-grasp fold amidoligase family protein n=1 Tax=Microvirga soli TaxID=1854496 RepID=UPI00191E7ECF|nr:ATP-grasp fold amidoligase family protein [Microvirga soli]